jgi:hypothetical protein
MNVGVGVAAFLFVAMCLGAVILMVFWARQTNRTPASVGRAL